MNDSVVIIYKNFVKTVLSDKTKSPFEKIKVCKRLFNAIYNNSNEYVKALLNQLRIEMNALLLNLECSLIEFVTNELKNK